jgi:Mn2+/Fe2+ NRAMP family transporter
MTLAQRSPSAPSPETPMADRQTLKPSFIKQLGPGLITGAADDDPSGIATY